MRGSLTDADRPSLERMLRSCRPPSDSGPAQRAPPAAQPGQLQLRGSGSAPSGEPHRSQSRCCVACLRGRQQPVSGGCGPGRGAGQRRAASHASCIDTASWPCRTSMAPARTAGCSLQPAPGQESNGRARAASGARAHGLLQGLSCTPRSLSQAQSLELRLRSARCRLPSAGQACSGTESGQRSTAAQHAGGSWSSLLARLAAAARSIGLLRLLTATHDSGAQL